MVLLLYIRVYLLFNFFERNLGVDYAAVVAAGSEAVLGPPQPVCHQLTHTGVPLEQAVSRQRLRPGSGFLAVKIITDGPTSVLHISDIKEKVMLSPSLCSTCSSECLYVVLPCVSHAHENEIMLSSSLCVTLMWVAVCCHIHYVSHSWEWLYVVTQSVLHAHVRYVILCYAHMWDDDVTLCVSHALVCGCLHAGDMKVILAVD
jgi:hypothetical protein